MENEYLEKEKRNKVAVCIAHPESPTLTPMNDPAMPVFFSGFHQEGRVFRVGDRANFMMRVDPKDRRSNPSDHYEVLSVHPPEDVFNPTGKTLLMVKLVE